ncbi:uncharacterized protein N7459_005096 [Penicillium hispanicum]|uniref:uncharacterized protein n=1 Tax=Penicillium hispanicum TaxID=1080232 RepID=UPI0025415F6B|nr:uncharacterized protein N7459_005096 [Penicillium hispanicum]KAJ5585296.1 hypothetical protein N7459_005096 [Penicillium hispanicum]
MGRHNRGRAQWDEVVRVEELESEEDEYGRELIWNGRAAYMRQLEYGGRGPRRRPADYEDLTDENESAVDGGDYDLYDHEDSTVAYAVQLAMRDKEDQLVDKALERIRRAQMLGKKNVRLSQRELDALERRRQKTNASGSRRKHGNSSNSRATSRRSGPGAVPEQQAGPYPTFGPDGSWSQGATSAHGRPSSSSSSHRPRTPTMQSLRPQQSNSPLRPTYPSFPERIPPTGRPQSVHQSMYARPLPDDPQWAPPYYNPMQMTPYPTDQPSYPPQLPSDLRIGPQSWMGYPTGMSPIQAQHQTSQDGRQSMSTPQPRGALQAQSESESEVSSEEEEESSESSDEDGEGVQIVPTVERPSPPGLQRRTVSGGSRGRQRAGR